MNNNLDDFVPLIWQGDTDNVSPNYGGRGNLYGVNGIPHAQFGGYIQVVGGGGNMYPSYLSKYNQVLDDEAPIAIDLDFKAGSTGELSIIANIEVTEDITTTNNKIVYIVTRRISNEYFCSVADYHDESFTLSSVGETGTYEYAINIDPEWNLADLKAVAIVQTFSGNHQILQAETTTITGLLPLISASITSGPAGLGVNFESQSFPQGGVVAWEWDLDGDGVIDSTDPNTSFLYETPGTYDVTLTISDGIDFATLNLEDYITVTGSNDISGEVAGLWSVNNSPYIITGDVTIANGNTLEIEPGVEIQITNNSKIEIIGNMEALGTFDEPILFTSNDSWNGFKIPFASGPTKLSYCIISKSIDSGIYIEASDVIIEHCTFYENGSNNAGAAIELNAADNVLIEGNLIANNISTMLVGGIGMQNSSPIINNNIIVNNTGNVAGAFSFKAGSTPILTNNTIANNEYYSNNGGAIFSFSSNPTFTNCILRDENNVILSAASTPIITYSNISGGYEGEGNIDADPLFTNPSGGNGFAYDGINAEWYFQIDSPCIDAGNPDAAFYDLEDPDNPGNALFPAMGSLTNDMGAFGGNGAIVVENNEKSIDPISFTSINIYPNPFNPTTTISMNLSNIEKNFPITLEIYNVKGQLVKSLLNNEQIQSNKIIWNGIDNENENVSSGMYFAKLITAEKTSFQKMVLIK